MFVFTTIPIIIGNKNTHTTAQRTTRRLPTIYLVIGKLNKSNKKIYIVVKIAMLFRKQPLAKRRTQPLIESELSGEKTHIEKVVLCLAFRTTLGWIGLCIQCVYYTRGGVRSVRLVLEYCGAERSAVTYTLLQHGIHTYIAFHNSIDE